MSQPALFLILYLEIGLIRAYLINTVFFNLVYAGCEVEGGQVLNIFISNVQDNLVIVLALWF